MILVTSLEPHLCGNACCIAFCPCFQNEFHEPDEGMVAQRRSGNDENISFSIVWDNVQIEVHRKHQGYNKSNNFKMWAMTFAVIHRNPSLHLDNATTVTACEIPASAFLPQPEDWHKRRQRCAVIVQRILQKHIPWLNVPNVSAIQHIPHEKSATSTEKSKVINLGVIEANPSTTTGAVQIMQTLHKYVPQTGPQSCNPVPCHGDQLSVERMTKAKNARVRGRTSFGRLEGLVECGQEFHKEGINLQASIYFIFK